MVCGLIRRAHRAEAAVCRPVGRTELLRPQAGQRLHLVATGKERELLRIGGANVCEPFGQQIKRIVPRNRIEDAVAALGAGTADHRVLQLRLRILLHDARAALGAEHTLIHNVITVALNETNVRFAVFLLSRDVDATAASAHVASCVMHRLLAAVIKQDGPLSSWR